MIKTTSVCEMCWKGESEVPATVDIYCCSPSNGNGPQTLRPPLQTIPTMPAGPAANDHAMLCALTHKTSIPFGTEYTVCLPQKKQTSRTITAAFGKHFRNRFACHYHFTTNMTLLSAGGLVTLSFSAGRLDSIVTRLSVSEGHSISQEQDQVYACYSPHCRNYLSFVVGAV